MQTSCDSASAARAARLPLPSRPPARRTTRHARHPSGVWIPCPTCGLEQPEAPDCAVCGADMVSGADMGVAEANPGVVEQAPPFVLEPVTWEPSETVEPAEPEPRLLGSSIASTVRSTEERPGRYRDASRIELGVSADYRGAELSHAALSPIAALGLLVLGVGALFFAASWFIEFTGGEIRAMADVVDRLALPATACATCEKPFRIVELRARPYYDAPSERMKLLDSERAAASVRWVEQMRREVEEAKAWAEEQRRWQEEEEERLRALAD